MNGQCLNCKKIKKDIQDIRGNEEYEPVIVLEYPQFSNLPTETVSINKLNFSLITRTCYNLI